ncbi:MAG: 50S ribosomal protein L22 [Calditrichia bacterium]
MQATAKEKYIKMSPTKVRQVVGLVKNHSVEETLNILHFTPKRAAKILEKAVRSAVANYYQNDEVANVSPRDIVVKNIQVDEGPTLRRFRPMSMGRVGRIRRRTSHITVVIDDLAD